MKDPYACFYDMPEEEFRNIISSMICAGCPVEFTTHIMDKRNAHDIREYWISQEKRLETGHDQ